MKYNFTFSSIFLQGLKLKVIEYFINFPPIVPRFHIKYKQNYYCSSRVDRWLALLPCNTVALGSNANKDYICIKVGMLFLC